MIDFALNLPPESAALWFLGQAGYIFQSHGVSVAIDPYLTDSIAEDAPEFSRLFEPPLTPEELKVDILILTHAHQDHLDPDTIRRYRHKDVTSFIAPRFAADKLVELGVPKEKVVRLHAGEKWEDRGVIINGVFAIPTGTDVLDTTGYQVTFANGRSVYHTSDTGYSSLLLAAAPKGVDVLLVPINGKWGNLSLEQAVEFTAGINPRIVLPNHYDLMALNAENPETFRWLCTDRQIRSRCIMPERSKPFVWGPVPLGDNSSL